jgi:hypothetical protein
MPRLWEGWRVIEFGVLSISLMVGTAQGLVLALMLWRVVTNRAANRWLALLIVAVAALITPYIIGFAGFYDRWPWLSFTPLSYTLAFGPLLLLYAATLCGRPPERAWPHFLPVVVQFAADALVFPFPLAIKDWWDTVAHAPIIAPALRVVTFISLAVYGHMAWRCWADYRRWLGENVTDAVDFDPDWIRNFLLALGLVGLVWLGFFIANVRDPTRNYFDQFWLYVIFSGLVIYLGVEGWRHAGMRYPVPGKTVRSAESWSFTPDGKSLVIKGGKASETMAIAEFRRGANGSVTLVADGSGEENGRTVMVREILTRDGPVLRLTRMSRTVGQPFIMRHSYQLRPAA